MRSGRMKSGVLELDGNFYGFSLGADFCAEHEWGIGDLKSMFGVEPKLKAVGIADMQFTKTPSDCLLFFEKGKRSYLLCSHQIHHSSDIEKFKADFHKRPTELYIYGDQQMAGAWSGRDFGIMVDKKTHGKQLKELYDAILNKDVAFCFTSALPAFDRSGLCLIIVSKFPPVFNTSLTEMQQSALDLQAKADATGLLKYLAEKGKRFYACSPSINDKKSLVGREVPVTPDGLLWWLNPMDQQEDTHGWFSTQELKDWADKKEGNLIAGKGYAHKNR